MSMGIDLPAAEKIAGIVAQINAQTAIQTALTMAQKSGDVLTAICVGPPGITPQSIDLTAAQFSPDVTAQIFEQILADLQASIDSLTKSLAQF